MRHGPLQALRISDALVCSAVDQVVWRWALLERGIVQSILGVAGEATNRRYSPLIAAAHVTWYGGGASNQNVVRLGLGQWTNDA